MEFTLAYDELATEKQFMSRVRALRYPSGRRRDSSIVGIYKDALRHKDGALTVAYDLEAPATMFADDSLIDIRYDDLARMLAFEKPAGTVIQFRYSTIPDPGYALINLISSRAEQGTHTLASLLQAANLEFLESSAKFVPYRRSVLTMWVRVPAKKRINSTISALLDFKHAMREHVKANGLMTALCGLPEIYRRTADDAVVRRTLEDEKRNYNHANRVWRQIDNSSQLMF